MGDLRSHDLGLMSRFVKHLNTFTCYVYHEKHGKWGPGNWGDYCICFNHFTVHAT